MSKSVENMSWEEIQAERAAIAAERAAMEVEKAKAAGPGGYVIPSPDDYGQVDAATVADVTAAPDVFAPAPWPHDHLTHCGLELEVRIPNRSALMAVSMLQQLDGHGELQMEIFNTFLANHLSTDSLGKVIKEFTRPDTEMTMQSLVQALVNLRISQGEPD